MNPTGINKDSMSRRVSDAEKIRLGLKKMPRGKLTVKVVYPVRVGSGAMYYQTEMISKAEIDQWKAEHKGLVIYEMR